MKGTLDLQSIQQDVEHERATKVARIAELVQQQTQPADSRPEWLDSAEAETEHERQIALPAQAERQLEQIKAALQRLKTNQYSYCVSCGQAINPKRLSALPYVLTCIHCQQREEAQS